ncbi:ribonuclease D [Candidatus Pelagibacter sp.]|nr:ribonuclease D [Candidatus Pelagibacter sp.]|tara:strand:+ start:2868 stop:3479 length:612 start_codon:yes stop_codon:yes gene_type:complete
MNLDIKLHKKDLPDEIKFSDKIAIDCEFTGLNIVRDRLCLLQISSGNNDAHIIQLDKDNYNAPNLKKILSDSKINKLFHYARADLLFIKKYLEVDVENVNCTKIMSKIARSYSDKHGLKDLIKEFIGIDISKQLQSSYFGGDLSDKQLKYCAQDVLYLHKVFDCLKNILEREQRLDLYQRTIKFINTRVELDYASFKDDVWSH